STPFDRNLFQWIVVRTLRDANLPVDDNSLDPVPILRAPFALHYRRLTPSLPFTDDTFNEAVDLLRRLEKMPERERVEESARLVKSWRGEWTASQVAPSAFEDDLIRWKAEAEA